ncbi:MAG: glycosyltransferase family 4 protein [Candidatus Bathyarchaeia archaeon]
MGGGATRAYNMAKGLSLAGCNVTIVTAFPHYPTGNIPAKYRRKLLTIENEGKLRIIRTFVPPLASEGFTKRFLLFTSFVFSSIASLPIVRKVDVVWASNPNIIAMIPSLMYKLLDNCPVVQNVDDLWPEALYDLGMNRRSLSAKLGEFVAKVTYRFATAITPISPAYVKVLTQKYNVNPSKVSVVPAGVDLAMFPCKSITGSRKGKFRVLYIGAFSPAYDFGQVFQAAKLLANSEEIEFVIQGGGELASALKSKIEEAKSNNVKVIEKIVSRQEVVKELDEADALLLPLNGIGSIEMGISSKLYEYQAAGKPIICCSNGQPARYISETKSGIIVKPGDYEAIVKAVINLMANYEFARKLGENGHNYVESEASIETVGLKMKQLLSNIAIGVSGEQDVTEHELHEFIHELNSE